MSVTISNVDLSVTSQDSVWLRYQIKKLVCSYRGEKQSGCLHLPCYSGSCNRIFRWGGEKYVWEELRSCGKDTKLQGWLYAALPLLTCMVKVRSLVIWRVWLPFFFVLPLRWGVNGSLMETLCTGANHCTTPQHWGMQLCVPWDISRWRSKPFPLSLYSVYRYFLCLPAWRETIPVKDSQGATDLLVWEISSLCLLPPPKFLVLPTCYRQNKERIWVGNVAAQLSLWAHKLVYPQKSRKKKQCLNAWDLTSLHVPVGATETASFEHQEQHRYLKRQELTVSFAQTDRSH